MLISFLPPPLPTPALSLSVSLSLSLFICRTIGLVAALGQNDAHYSGGRHIGLIVGRHHYLLHNYLHMPSPSASG